MQEQSSMKQDSGDEDVTKRDGLLQKYGPYLFLGGLAVYLILLSIGVIAEIFDIQSILDWWIWRPPGR